MDDATLAKLLLARGWVSAGQLASLLGALKPGRLEEVVLERGWVSEAQFSELKDLSETTRRFEAVLSPEQLHTVEEIQRSTIRYDRVISPSGHSLPEEEPPEEELRDDVPFARKPSPPEVDPNAMTAWDGPAPAASPAEDPNAQTSWEGAPLAESPAEAADDDPASATLWDADEKGAQEEEKDPAEATLWDVEGEGGPPKQTDDAAEATLWDLDRPEGLQRPDPLAALDGDPLAALDGPPPGETTVANAAEEREDFDDESTRWTGRLAAPAGLADASEDPAAKTHSPDLEEELGDTTLRPDDQTRDPDLVPQPREAESEPEPAGDITHDPDAKLPTRADHSHHPDDTRVDEPGGSSVAFNEQATAWDESGGSAPPDLLGKGSLGGGLAAYRFASELGRGGMGAVFRAVHNETGREVAIKRILLPTPSAVAQERFRREGELAARLDHPGVLKVHDLGKEGIDGLYLVMELVEGARSLDAVAKESSREERLQLLLQAADALGYAHGEGVFHRDVKPDNLLVDAYERIKVADFGLASSANLERLTRTGAQLGTPGYMAPEQVRGDREAQGAPTDVWALGVILYELLVDERPFQGTSIYNLYQAIQEAQPKPLRAQDPTIPAGVEAVCFKALRRDPAERYPDGAAMAADLRRALAGEPTEAQPLSALRSGLGKLLRWLVPLLALGALIAALAITKPWRSLAQGGGEASAPRLILEEQPPGELRARTLRIAGRVVGEGPLKVWLAGYEDDATRTTPQDPTFRLRVTLPAGRHQLTLLAEDEQGRRVEALAFSVHSLIDLPRWYLQLDPRPPLPPGLTPGELDGDYVWERDGSVLRWLPPGEFSIGGPTDPFWKAGSGMFEHWRSPTPRQAKRTRGVYIGKYEVSWAQFARFCAETGHEAPPRGFFRRVNEGKDPGDMDWAEPAKQPHFVAPDDHPVHGVTYDDAMAYCAWAGLRLPTSLEWEFAARGVRGGIYPWGDEDPYYFTAPVHAFPAGASPLGCLNMSGNVQEICGERFAPFPEQVPPDYHLPMPPKATLEALPVVRGGGWPKVIPMVFRACNFRRGSLEQTEDVGFRIALEPPLEKTP